MFARIGILLIVGVGGYLAATANGSRPATAAVQAPAAASFGVSARVTRVIDGDTVVVRIGRRTERVRLVGIDAPEAHDCYGAQATAAARRLALNRRVTLYRDRTQSQRDRYGRLLDYVVPRNGRDLGGQLILGGYARIYVFNRPFANLTYYRVRESAAKNAHRGLWGACATPTTSTTQTSTTTPTTSTTTTTTTTTPSRCAASYPDVCIPPPPPDLNCKDVPYNNIRVIYNVPNPDPHEFDRDRDGIGCES